MVKRLLLFLALVVFQSSLSFAQKRDFRGAWIQCVNGQFVGLGTTRMQLTLTHQLNELQKDGVNVIIFQVRPECDALYESSLEPWSRFLTGKQGKAPDPYWDPLQWMITECHKRGMELHAWFNPFRARTKTTKELAPSHIARRNPSSCFEYDDLLILNPGLPENRDYICEVVRDIVSRYDVDGIHFDDYFYPYPVKGLSIPDAAQFRQYSNGIRDIGDWRRYNVSLFVEQLYRTVHDTKPWVKVGISPFGIYRNKKSSPIGSETNGTQNYDDLYADILLWVNNGWLDYNVPQLYWEIGHKVADYETLINWWSKHASARPLIIGEDIERTVKHPDPEHPDRHQQDAKMQLHYKLPAVKGTVLWYAKAAVDNVGNYATNLRNIYWRYPALQPSMPFISDKAPKKVRKVKPVWTSDGYVLFWTAPKGKDWRTQATKYVVYRFLQGEPRNLDDPSHIVTITHNTYLRLPYEEGKVKYVYVVTALNRLQNESKPVTKKIKL